MKRVFDQFWRLMSLCLSGPGARFGLVLFAIVVALDLGGVYATIRIVEWTGAFYGALEAMDVNESIRQVGIFGVIVALNSARHLTGQWFRKHLEMRWRRSLTNGALDIWMTNRAYWHLANGARDLSGAADSGPHGVHLDNPDQRIAEDCRIFLQLLLGEALDMIGRVVGLFSYLVLLWNLAAFPLSLDVIGLPITIPNYMIWAAFLYVALSSLLTHGLGYPLKGLVVEQQRREANFRFALSRLRTSVDEVALSDGERAERAIFANRFDAIIANWRLLVNRELILGCFTYPFNHSVLRIPLFVALPGYLAGHVAFGGLMQLSTAFSSVVTSLSWFIFSYRDLAELVAASSRLDTFLEAAKRAGAKDSGIMHKQSLDGTLSITGLALQTPDGRDILGVPVLAVQPGEAVWLHGASGLGKTSLFKALAGLWRHGSGEMRIPAESRLFLPQKPYFPIGDMHAAIAYPGAVTDFAPAALRAALKDVGLGDRATEFGRSDSRVAGSHGLSGGELQRLALARLLLHRPRWALLDEPTSALDADAEATLFALLRQRLPDTAFIIIAHRQPRGLGAIRAIDLTAARSGPGARTPLLVTL